MDGSNHRRARTKQKSGHGGGVRVGDDGNDEHDDMASPEVTSPTSHSVGHSRADDVYIVSMYTTLCWSTQTSNDRQRSTRNVVLVERTLANDASACSERRRQVIESLPALDQRHRLTLNYEFVLNVTATKRAPGKTGGATKCDRASLIRSLTFVGVRNEDPASRSFCENLRDNEWLRRTISDVFTLHVSDANINTWSAVYKDFLSHEHQRPPYDQRGKIADQQNRLDNESSFSTAIYDLPGPPVPVPSTVLDAHATRNSCEFIEERISDIIDGLDIPDA